VKAIGIPFFRYLRAITHPDVAADVQGSAELKQATNECRCSRCLRGESAGGAGKRARSVARWGPSQHHRSLDHRYMVGLRWWPLDRGTIANAIDKESNWILPRGAAATPPVNHLLPVDSTAMSE
jgi:hypothetical protein